MHRQALYDAFLSRKSCAFGDIKSTVNQFFYVTIRIILNWHRTQISKSSMTMRYNLVKFYWSVLYHYIRDPWSKSRKCRDTQTPQDQRLCSSLLPGKTRPWNDRAYYVSSGTLNFLTHYVAYRNTYSNMLPL